MKLLAGTSGYGFREWVGSFYPKGTKPVDYLGHYASVFRTVEINYTFRRFPNPALAAKWRDATPAGFRFAVKAHQSITHRARLADTETSVVDFVKALEPLGERLGPVLFQCPPWFRRNDDRLSRFLTGLPAGRRYALEFRHASWHCGTVRSLCREAGAALVAGVGYLDEEIRVPVTTDFAYIRLRRNPPYQPDERRRIAAMLTGLSDRVETGWLYVKHDGPGFAPGAVSWIQGLPGGARSLPGGARSLPDGARSHSD